MHRIYTYLYLSFFVVKIQKNIKGFLIRKYNFCRGPALLNRSLCNNTNDFFTCDTVSEIKPEQFFSFKDEDGFIYGFDIVSMYNLIDKSEIIIKNPYNRLTIHTSITNNFKSLIRLSKLLNIPICSEIKIDNLNSKDKTTELRVLDLFQNIDSLGNYTNSSWFMNLTRSQIIKFMRELRDIWTFRLQLTMEIKKSICPPLGDPFLHINEIFYPQENMDILRNKVIDILEKLVNTGTTRDYKSLGAYYVLGALTLVSIEAAISLPWLYQSVCYN